MPHWHATPSLRKTHSRHRTVYPHSGRLRRCRTHRKKQPIHRGNVIGSACASDRWHSGEPPIVSCIEDIEEALTAADVDTPAFYVNEKIVGIAAQFNACNTRSIAGGKDSQFRGTTEGNEDALSILVERHGKIRSRVLHRPCCLLLTADGVQ